MTVSLSFARLKDTELDAFAEGVIKGLGDHAAAFPTPPITVTNLRPLVDGFTTALAKARLGGPPDTAEKNIARANLIDALRTDAAYVEQTADNLSDLLGSGYTAASTNHSQTVLATPKILSVTNGASTILVLRVTPITNARSYEVQTSTNGDAPTIAAVSTKARMLELTGLTPGTLYTIQVRAVGGSTGFSDWSEPVTHMAT
jgi:hypothetical protein